MLPAALLSPVATALADRFRRDQVLRWTCAVRAAALAGCAATVGDPAATLGTAAALTLGAGLLLAGLSYDARPSTSRGAVRDLIGEAIDGFRTLRRHPDVFLLVRLTLAQAMTRGCFTVLVVVVAIDVLGVGDAGVGVLTAAVGAGAVIGSLAVSLFADGRRLAVILGLGVALWGLPLAVAGAVPRQGVILTMLAAVGVGKALVDVGIFTLPPRLVPNDVLARLFGALESLGALVVAAACLLTPALLELIGTRWALVVVGAFGPIYVALAWRRLRAIDATVKRRDHEIGLLDELPIFRPLALPVIELLADRLEGLTVAAGDYVVTQGDDGDRFYVIEHGTARVVCDGAARPDLVDGDCFGEIALLLDVPRTASVITTTTLRMHTLQRDDFLAAVASQTASRTAADRVVAQRLDADLAPLH